MKIRFNRSTAATCEGSERTTLQVIAALLDDTDKVLARRVVQGFTDKASRNAKARAVFADLIAGQAPAAPASPDYPAGWEADILGAGS